MSSAAFSEAISRSTDLVALEAIVDKGKHTFVEVGLALARIHQGELYTLTHSTWEKYCEQRWGWSRSYAHRLMLSARAADALSMGNTPVPNERIARELTRAPVELRQGILLEATEVTGGKPTAKVVREVTARALYEGPARVDGREKPPSLQTRRTPRWLFDFLAERFGGFSLDAYAEPHNALCPVFLTEEQDGNTSPWANQTFWNPPFKKMLPPVQQALRQAENGVRSIGLTPVGCSQDWFQQLAIRGTIYKPDRRISYDTPEGASTDPRDGENGADRDTDIIAFGGEHENPYWRRGEFRVLRLDLPEVPAP